MRVQRRGNRVFGRHIVIVAERAAQSCVGKVGITIPKKVGQAHVRNKIRRRIRHIFRLKQKLFFEKNLVVIARSSSSTAAFLELELDIHDACSRIRLDRNRPRQYRQGVL